MMDPKIKSDWLKALRSGEYKQTCGIMKDAKGFCCLGVLCAIQGETFEGLTRDALNTSYVAPQYAAGLEKYQQEGLAGKNDHDWSFAEIADYIEEKL